MQYLTWQGLQPYFSEGHIGFWKLELENGRVCRMYVDERMRILIGASEDATPEECYAFFIEHVCPEDRTRLAEHCASMLQGDAEILYRYEHPTQGELQIQCSGRKVGEQDGKVSIMGYHREFSDVVRLEEDQQREKQLLSRNRELLREQLQTDNYYRMLMDMTSCGIVSYTLPEHRMLYMNKEALRLYGADSVAQARANMVGILKKTSFLDPETLPNLVALREKNGEVEYECVIPDKDGGTMTLLAHSESFVTPQGERAIFSTFLDVSENTALRKEKSIRDTLCSDYTAVYLVDLLQDSVVPVTEATRIDDANGRQRLGDRIRSFSARMQFTYDELLIHESAPDFLQKMNAEYLMKYLRENRRFILRCRMKPNPGEHEWFEIQIVRINSSESFQVVMGFRFVDDVLQEEKRKKETLENALASANRKNEIITAISRQYWQVFEVDLKSNTYQEVFTEGRFTMDAPNLSGRAQEDFCRVLNEYTAEEHLAQLRDFLDLDTIAERLADTNAVMMEFRAKVGFWASVRYLALTRDADGHVTKVIFLLEIIDQQKRKELEYQKKLKEAAEEASRANAAKTNFLRRMSHDIRTPLNGIIGLLKIDETHYDDADLIRENRRKMLTSADHLLSLINDVLQMSRLEDGKIVLTHEPICLYDLTQNIVDIIIGRAVEAGVRWDYERGKSEIPYPYIYGSPLHLRQIFLNIYGNCIKYNRPGGKITTVVDTLPEHDGICTYHWVISDTGIGMSEEFIKRIFEPFSQERSNARSAYQGTGLGMSIVKGLLEQMGGTISVTSEVGVGSTFEITIPFEIAPAPASLPEQYAQDNQDICGLHLLLAEDNELNAEIAQTLLTDEGAEVTVVHDGRQAVDAFSEHPAGTYDAILMDMMMPVMDGLAATKAIRELDRPDAKAIPIIAMTANAFAEDARKCMDAGMNAHLAKPLDIQKVKQVISRQTETHER